MDTNESTKVNPITFWVKLGSKVLAHLHEGLINKLKSKSLSKTFTAVSLVITKLVISGITMNMNRNYYR